mmetsp:Transcript_20294/g.30126  ORF Transcript_20294/g.30126 Transcript_20294/m.30126 type:complete len:87 (+) Transcript_20294:44-304(+)
MLAWDRLYSLFFEMNEMAVGHLPLYPPLMCMILPPSRLMVMAADINVCIHSRSDANQVDFGDLWRRARLVAGCCMDSCWMMPVSFS